MTYWYRDHQRGGQRTEERVRRETFIGRMVQHILPKGGKRIRYYGLHATCIMKQMRERVMAALQVAVQQVMDGLGAPATRQTYRMRMRTTLGRDPLVCPQCGSELWLWQIWHPQYGIIYDELECMLQGAYDHERSAGAGVARIDRDRAGDVGSGSDGHVQLPLFALLA